MTVKVVSANFYKQAGEVVIGAQVYLPADYYISGRLPFTTTSFFEFWIGAPGLCLHKRLVKFVKEEKCDECVEQILKSDAVKKAAESHVQSYKNHIKYVQKLFGIEQ